MASSLGELWNHAGVTAFSLSRLWHHPIAVLALMWAYIWGASIAVQEFRWPAVGEDRSMVRGESEAWQRIAVVSMCIGYTAALLLALLLLGADATGGVLLGLSTLVGYIVAGFILSIPAGAAVIFGLLPFLMLWAIIDGVTRSVKRLIRIA
ncbi:MAG TPA: hypothetical protein VL137_01845 [Polyangiaceae bacterium]|nr:hypothetical protein [Polyangiaceae bacterium]